MRRELGSVREEGKDAGGVAVDLRDLSDEDAWDSDRKATAGRFT